ncbi:MAG: hypothetical protein PHF17_01755 [Arcobacteraceae bacterium]|nr:hypothetical protein [Arcobacteraceae bacterium]
MQITPLYCNDIDTTVSTATINSDNLSADYFTSLTLLNGNELNYKLFVGSNDNTNINTMNTVTLNYINPIETLTIKTPSPANNMLITKVLNDIQVLDYSENSFGSYIGNFNKLSYPETFRIKQSFESNYIISYSNGKIVIDEKP